MDEEPKDPTASLPSVTREITPEQFEYLWKNRVAEGLTWTHFRGRRLVGVGNHFFYGPKK